MKRGRTRWGRWVVWGAASAFLGMMLAMLGGCVAVDRMVRPARHTVGDSPNAFPAETVRFASESGDELVGWLALPDPAASSPGLSSQPGQGVVVLLHGNRADRRQMLGRAQALRRLGFATLVVDSSAHGESAGERITLGYREALDARAAVAFARDRFPGQPVAALGFSLGGAALALAASSPEFHVDALVLEAVFPDLETAVRRRVFPSWRPLNAPLTRAVLRRVHSRLEIEPDDVRPVSALAQVRCPVMIVAGERDFLAPPEDARRLQAAVPTSGAAGVPAELWIVPGAGHGDFHAAAPEEYENRVGVFLRQVLDRGATGDSQDAAGP